MTVPGLATLLSSLLEAPPLVCARDPKPDTPGAGVADSDNRLLLEGSVELDGDVGNWGIGRAVGVFGKDEDGEAVGESLRFFGGMSCRIYERRG